MINLSILLIIPLVTAIFVMLCKTPSQVRWIALFGSIAQLVYASVIMYAYIADRAAGNTAQMLYQSRYSWFIGLNIEYYVGVDGISIAMIMLTAVVVMTGILISWNINKLTKEFFFLILLLSLGAYGFFISLDLFTMFFF